MIRSDNEVYKIIEGILKTKATPNKPMSCLNVWDSPDIKAWFKENQPQMDHSRSVARLSDFLGHMCRRGLLERFTAPEIAGTSRARYAYTWKSDGRIEPERVTPLHVVRNERSKPNVTITEDDSRIVLDFADFTITVQSKR